jgi:hypothetical protein
MILGAQNENTAKIAPKSIDEASLFIAVDHDEDLDLKRM